MQPILDFPFDLRTPTNKQTLCKLNRCDAGWWRYQLNTKWWYRQGNPRQCGNASGNTINRTNWLEMGQTSKSQGAHAAILDFPFDLGTPTNRGERSNLRLQHLLTWISEQSYVQTFPCESESIFDPIKSFICAWVLIVTKVWCSFEHYALHNGYLGAQPKTFNPLSFRGEIFSKPKVVLAYYRGAILLDSEIHPCHNGSI